MSNYELLRLFLILQDISDLLYLIDKYRVSEDESMYC